jgi:uncharacterized protein (TIGR02246 family)
MAGGRYSHDELSTMREIEELIAAYCYAVDDGDARAVVALFDDAAELDVGNGVVIRGALELGEFFERRLARYSASSHHVSNIRVRLDGDRATARSYVYARIWPVGDVEAGELWARYDDVVASTTAGWRIRRRQIRAAGWHGFPTFVDQPSHFERLPRHDR